MAIFDAHNHLQDARLAHTLDDDMRSADEVGVKHMVCCGTEPDDWDRVLDIAAAHSCVIPSLGLHPWYVNKAPENWFEKLQTLTKDGTIPIGETGLDFAIDEPDRPSQEAAFIRQLELSAERKVPLSVHCRKAWAGMIEILNDFGPHPKGLVLHAFSGSKEIIDRLAPLNAFFSFGGSLTYPMNKRGPNALRHVPADRLLIETDAPDITPHDLQDAINRPQNLPLICQQVADLREQSVHEIARITSENGCRLFC